jgi:hypothetical protein
MKRGDTWTYCPQLLIDLLQLLTVPRVGAAAVEDLIAVRDPVLGGGLS